MKEYKEIDCCDFWGFSLSEVVLQLQDCAKRGELVKTDFNGVILYSDTVTMDGAYKAVTGLTKAEYDEMLRKEKEKAEREEKEHKEAIPRLTKEWIEKGHKILKEKYWDYWDKCVPIRLNDLYKGWELGGCLKLVESLQNDGDFEKAKKLFYEQGHSGMSAHLMSGMLIAFCENGKDFVKYMGFKVKEG